MALKLNILVAEDDLRDQVLCEELFAQPHPLFVHYVWSGEEVVDYLTGKGPFAARAKYPYPDILILDMEMPRMNGLQVLEWLAANPTVVRPDTYICTGAAASPMRPLVEKHPIKGFLVKPIQQAQIRAIIDAKMLL